MNSILLTAFKPYGPWSSNASWLCVEQLTRHLPSHIKLTTRLYPVDFAEVRSLLESDLRAGYDVALHLGQAPGAARIQLEQLAVNVAGHPEQVAEDFDVLEPNGPQAYRSALPLARWAKLLRGEGIPTAVSYHAGTYLCNATLYWSHYFAEHLRLPTKSAFVHLPLDVSQAVDAMQAWPAMPAATSAAAVQQLLVELAGLTADSAA